MTSKERITNIMKHKPVDRIGVHEHFWAGTHKSYVSKGKIREEETFGDHFNLDFILCKALSLVIDLDYKPEVFEETDETIVTKDGNGVVLRNHKKHDSTPEHIDFSIKTREDWETVKPLLTKIDERRIAFDSYRVQKEKAQKENRYFSVTAMNVFELIHRVVGHETFLMNMYLDPDWVLDMVHTYADITVTLLEILFSKEGLPDGFWTYDDLGFKERPFISPEMYEEFIMPAHKKIMGFAHLHNLPVVLHSCGYIEPLIPKMIEAGVDCLQAIEIKAGMDLIKLHNQFGDKLSFMGGRDVRTLYTNDKRIIDEELEAKIPIVKQGYNFILHSDHSIPETVNYETLVYYFEKGLALGKYG